MTPLRFGMIDLVILTALEQQPRYGLELSDHIGSRSGGLLAVGEGTLYPALLRLSKAKLIEGERHPTPGGGGPREVHRLTGSGARKLERRKAESQKLQRVVNALLMPRRTLA
ncbi:PadR family transcriptional regulator [Deinococcus hopiensis]|uniref:PadR family transcriptional regulator, regulatory protein PadR n=1 Tax=Deinococcus hopiensis KR-140 TaxID=695939 RepID=A0A1W1VPF7_9DEIO|nr:PadR family transcriptional regulator [Deinococcus hopiensis]SMB95206.1 PadR family transcriptional regulator, regulatory protein PadR [Deinococcus hopiensis KR-140]